MFLFFSTLMSNLVLPTPAERKMLTRSKSRKAAAAKASKKQHQLAFCEPLLYPTFCGPRIVVSDEMYQSIANGPVQSPSNDEANGYVFGREYPLSEYEFAGQHDNDRASTGLIDIAAWKGNPSEVVDDKLEKFLDREGWRYSAQYSRLAQKLVPGQLWTGETVGGDVGASLYVHRRKEDGCIDSLIVDSGYGYYFPQP